MPLGRWEAHLSCLYMVSGPANTLWLVPTVTLMNLDLI